MPIHMGAWKLIKRTAKIAQAATIGVDLPGMTRKAGANEILAKYAQSDKDRQLEVNQYNRFNQTIGRFYEHPIPADEYAKIQMFAMEYFQSHANPEAYFILHPGKQTLKRIEIRDDSGFVLLWSA